MGRSLSVLLGVVLFCGCGLFGENGTVEVVQDDGYIIIDNGLTQEIFFHLGEVTFLHPNSWLPSFQHESIDGGKRKSILYENVPNGKDTGVVKGDNVAVYWWDQGYRGNDDLHVEYIVIE